MDSSWAISRASSSDRGFGGLHRAGAQTFFLSCTTPSVKRMSCGPRVSLFLQFFLDLDAPDAEDLVLTKLLLDEVDEMISQQSVAREIKL